ncbi:hypothetical protein EJ07DRAFT_159264 [Lizonia empirigonia]|nr:hypothetical protein EJ07DRAFT_159264 [Lizonia empirigonia]
MAQVRATDSGSESRDERGRSRHNQKETARHNNKSSHRSQLRSASTKTRFDDATDFSLEGIFIPNEDMTGKGPPRRPHNNAPRVDYTMYFSKGEARNKEEESQDSASFFNESAAAVNSTGPSGKLLNLRTKSTPPGPQALGALRQQILPYLLSRLPKIDDLVFSEHSKLQYARLRLLVGTYSHKNLFRWGNKVWAYLRLQENPNLRIGPKIELEVEEQYEGNGYDLKPVTWSEDFEENKVDREPLFKQVTSDAELKAAIKYCFLLATEVKLHRYQHHCIPVNSTFVNIVTKVCAEYGTHTSVYEGPQVSYYDDDRSNSVQHTPRRRQLNYPERIRMQGSPLEQRKTLSRQALLSQDSDLGQFEPDMERTLPENPTVKLLFSEAVFGKVKQTRPKAQGQAASSNKLPHQVEIGMSMGAPAGSRTEGSEHEGYLSKPMTSEAEIVASTWSHRRSHKRRMHKPKNLVAARNPLAKRRPSFVKEQSLRTDILKRQHKTLSGRISRYGNIITRHRIAIAKLETKRNNALEKKTLEVQMEDEAHWQGQSAKPWWDRNSKSEIAAQGGEKRMRFTEDSGSEDGEAEE